MSMSMSKPAASSFATPASASGSSSLAALSTKQRDKVRKVILAEADAKRNHIIRLREKIRKLETEAYVLDETALNV